MPFFLVLTKKTTTFAPAFADMAQLVEQRIRNAWVAGSSPAIGSLFCKKSQQSHFWILTLFLFLRI